MTENTLLLRQVHPSFIQQGHITSQIFKPTPKDGKLLSVYDGDQINAEDSWEHYVNTLHYQSAGVLAITVSECHEKGLTARSEPRLYPEHAVIDYSKCTETQIKKKAKYLKHYAENRGWLFIKED